MNRGMPRVDLRLLAAAGLVAVSMYGWGLMERHAMGAAAAPAIELAQVALQLAMVGCVALATLLGDQAADRGLAPVFAYGAALLLGSAAAVALQWALQAWAPAEAGPGRADAARLVKAFLDFMIWGAPFVWVYAALREKRRAARRMQAAQLQGEQIRRRALQAQLQALQARVEPGFLFGTLERVRQLYDSTPELAGKMLDDLVAYLRAALPRLREPGSTLGQELRLLAAYLAIRQDSLRTAATADLLETPVPPMLLLPLVAGLRAGAAQAPASIDVAARADGASLRLCVSAPPGDDGALGALVADLRERLAALHGERASLALSGGAGKPVRVVLTLPAMTNAA